MYRVEVEAQKNGRNETWTFPGLFPGCPLVDEKARRDCFVSQETGLEGSLLVSVSQVETKHLDFQRLSRVSFQFRPPKMMVLRGFCRELAQILFICRLVEYLDLSRGFRTSK